MTPFIINPLPDKKMYNIKYYMLCPGNKHIKYCVFKSGLQCLPSGKLNHVRPANCGVYK